MRIAFVKFRHVPFGGGEGYLDLLMEACAARGHEVHLVTTGWAGDTGGRCVVHPVTVRGLTQSARLRAFARETRGCLERERFDAALSLERTEGQDLWRAGEGVHRVWLDRRRAYEPAWRARLNEWMPRQRTLLALEAAAVRGSRVLIANSQVVRRDLEAVYPDCRDRIVVIPNGVDEARYVREGREANRAAVRAELGLGTEEPLVLFVGSGFRRKGLEELLRAWPDVPGAHLAVLGRDAAAPWRKRAARFGVADRVRFLPPRRDLAPLYQAADAVVLPTWFDSFSNVGLEAMRCGTGFVTTRFAGVHELVEPGVNGAVIDRPDDRAALVAALRGTLAAAREPGRADRIAASVQGHTMEHNVRRTLEVIERVAREKQAAGGRPA